MNGGTYGSEILASKVFLYVLSENPVKKEIPSGAIFTIIPG